MNRKTLIITGAVIILILGVGLYFYLQKAPTPEQAGGFFPGKSNVVTSTSPARGEEEVNIPFRPGMKPPRLYELHKAPVGGAGFIEAGKGFDHMITARYIERGLGHIYETPLATLTESRISNETHSQVTEAFWGNGGKSVAIRSFDEKSGAIKTHVLNLSDAVSPVRGTSTAPLSSFIRTEEVFLPDYIPFAAVAEDGADKFFYLENSPTNAVGSVATSKGASSAIFSSTFTEWLPQFPNASLVTLTTRPSSDIPGHLFFLNTQTKSVTKILGSIKGLTTKTSRDGKFVLYSETIEGYPELAVYDVAKKESRPLALQTLPEKCVWGMHNMAMVYCAIPRSLPKATYPDQWYQGLVSFSDEVIKIDTFTGRTEKVYSLPSLDAINPVISSDDNYFLFMNKVTGNPWVLRLAEDIIAPPMATSTAPTTSSVKKATSTTPSTSSPKPTNTTPKRY